VAVGPVVGVAAAGGVELLRSLVPFRMKAGLTLSVDTVTALPHMKSCSVFFFCDRTWYGPLQSAAHCVLTEEDVGAFLKSTVHECSWGGMASCRNWSEVAHVLAELGDEKRWVHWVGTRS
jgi:hypothetical protein